MKGRQNDAAPYSNELIGNQVLSLKEEKKMVGRGEEQKIDLA